MNNNEWIDDVLRLDTQEPTENLDGELLYTVYIRDFLQMPVIDFKEAAALDPNVRSLLN